MENWFLTMDSNIKALSKIKNFMDLVLLKLVMESTQVSSKMVLRMVKVNILGMMDLFTKAIIAKIKEMEKVFSNQRKEALKDNGKMIK